MDCLNCAIVSFHPSASIGHLCEKLHTLVGLGIGYDTFSIQNTKWLSFVNDIVSDLNNDKVLCVSFGLYPSYVAGILHSVKEINFFELCTKKFYYIQYIKRCIAIKMCTLRKLSKITFTTLPEEQQYELTYGGETVTLVFQMRLLPELPSELVLAESVLSRIRLSSLTYGIVSIDKHVTCIMNEVLVTRHDYLLEISNCDYLNLPKILAGCTSHTLYCSEYRRILCPFWTLHCTKSSHHFSWGKYQC